MDLTCHEELDEELIEQPLDFSHLLSHEHANVLLHMFSSIGDEEVVGYLLNHGLDVNHKDGNGITALMAAVREKQKNIIPILLSAGADVITLNNENKSVVHLTCENNLSAASVKLILQALSEQSTSIEQTAQRLIQAGCRPFHAACLSDVNVLESMLQQGFTIATTLYDQCLHAAVELGHVDITRVLLQHGVNPHAIDHHGANPVYYLYANDRRQHTQQKMQLLRILLDLQVSLTSWTSRGLFQMTPVLIHGNRHIIRAILQANLPSIFTAEEGTSGRKALHHLVCNKDPGVLQELKLHASKFDVNVIDDLGLNPVARAAMFKNPNMLEFLLTRGASANCVRSGSYGHTPLYFAYSHLDEFDEDIQEQVDQCVDLLLQYNADPQALVADEVNGQLISIFDVAIDNCDSLKYIVAHLALLERRGVKIKEIIIAKIRSYQSLTDYLDRCRKMLRKRFKNSRLTLFKLLTANKRRLARYACNKKLLRKLIRLSYKQTFKSTYLYYYNTVKQRFAKQIQRTKFQHAIHMAIYIISGYRIAKGNLITDRILDFLGEDNLHKLYEFSKRIRR